jgi:CMP-N,N'-diacetyllegionaminic acid synthase
MNQKKIIAIIPARRGSVGLPGKNIKIVGGYPLVEHSILQAINASKIDNVIVTTDCPEVSKIACKYSEKVILISRPVHLSQSNTSTEDVVKHACEFVDFSQSIDSIVLLQPTSPIRSSSQIDDSISILNKSKKNCLISVTEPIQHPSDFLIQSNGKIEYLYRDSNQSRRQDFNPAYFMNGSIYITKYDFFIKNNSIYNVDDCVLFQMPIESSIDIDTQFDFDLCKCVFQKIKESK